MFIYIIYIPYIPLSLYLSVFSHPNIQNASCPFGTLRSNYLLGLWVYQKLSIGIDTNKLDGLGLILCDLYFGEVDRICGFHGVGGEKRGIGGNKGGTHIDVGQFLAILTRLVVDALTLSNRALAYQKGAFIFD